MKNRELLIQILIELRSNGITNQKLLNLIEKMPPHYFIKKFKKYDTLRNITIKEIVNIVKLFNLIISEQSKIENFFISGFTSGWAIYIASQISKRVYCLSGNHINKNNIESLMKDIGVNNVFLKKGIEFEDWRVVAPFDIIMILKPIEKIAPIIINSISMNGNIFAPLINNNNIKIVKIKKSNKIQQINIDYNLLNNNII